MGSTDFEYLTSPPPNFQTSGNGANEPIGDFTFPIPPGLFDASGDPGSFVATSLSITFTVFDGDTATEDEPDFGDLFLSLGIPGTSSILELPLSLAGFGDQRLDTATNTLDLRDVVTTGLALAAFLSETQGTIRFFILDADEGGNRLTFTDAPEDDFFLSVTLDQRIPEPATLALLAMGIFLAAWHRRRKIAARS